MSKRQLSNRLSGFESLENRTLLAGDLAGAFGDSLERLTDTAVSQASSVNESLRISSQANLEGELLYTANGNNGSLELWKSDGTPDGTEKVRGGISNYADSLPGLNTINGIAYFTVQQNEGGEQVAGGDYELWRSDGTEAGTQLVIKLGTWSTEGQNISTIIDAGGGSILIALETSVFSSTTARFWTSDGTGAGTAAVGPEFQADFTSAIGDVINLNGKWIFNGVDKQPDSNRPRFGIWSNDDQGSIDIVREFAGDEFEGIPGPYSLVKAGDRIYFSGDDGDTGFELWATDGTADGTALVKDIDPTSEPFNPIQGSVPRDLTAVDSVVYFTADNGSSGRELWKSNGTADGTTMVLDMTPGGGSTSFIDLVDVEGQLFFTVGKGADGEELWTTDGTDAGTHKLTSTGNFFENLTAVDELLFFTLDDPDFGNELWVSDGTADGTGLAADINDGAADSNPQSLFAFGGGLFFVADDGQEGDELWSLSTSTTSSVPDTLLPGDVNGNGIVDFADFLVIAQGFGSDVTGGISDGDVDEDGKIGFSDFLVISENFGNRLL